MSKVVIDKFVAEKKTYPDKTYEEVKEMVRAFNEQKKTPESE